MQAVWVILEIMLKYSSLLTITKLLISCAAFIPPYIDYHTILPLCPIHFYDFKKH